MNQNRQVKVENKVLENKNVKENTSKLRKPNNLLFPKIGKFKGITETNISKSSVDKTKKKKKKNKQKQKQKQKQKMKKKKKSPKKKSNTGWAGPRPNCAWDGPGGCQNSRARSQDEAEEGKQVVIEKSRFSNLFPKRSEELEEKEEFSRAETRNVGSDKSKLLPGKLIKQRIEEHLRQREEERRNQKKVDFSSSSVKQGGSSTRQPSQQARSGRSRSSTVEVDGVQLYSVEEWLHMG